MRSKTHQKLKWVQMSGEETHPRKASKKKNEKEEETLCFMLHSAKQWRIPLPLHRRFFSHQPEATQALLRSTAPSKTQTSAPRYFATVYDHAHLSALLGLYEQLSLFYGETFRLLALSLDGSTLEKKYLHSINPVTCLGREKLSTQISGSKKGYVFTLKSVFVDYLAKTLNQCFLYLDTDIYFIATPEPLFHKIPREGFLLFPHDFCAPVKPNQAKHGSYNAGMIGIGENSCKLTQKWAELCLNRCEESHGYFYDQMYLDSLLKEYPSLMRVEKSQQHNRAVWNLLPNSKPLSLHASSPDTYHWWDCKILWDQYQALCHGMEHVLPLDSLLQQQASYDPQIDKIFRLHRKLLREEFPSNLLFNFRLALRNPITKLLNFTDQAYQSYATRVGWKNAITY